MRANYGYADASGEYFITIDTDLCDGCGECVEVCPEDIFEIVLDDYDEEKAEVKEGLRSLIGSLCPGYHAVCKDKSPNCHEVCHVSAISHSW